MTPSTPEQPAESYSHAVAEIDAILSELERDDLDVDLLADKVRRATDLLTWCRSRIRSASDEVQSAVATLEAMQVPPENS